MMRTKRYETQTMGKEICLTVELSREPFIHDTKLENIKENSTDKKRKKITRVEFRTEHEKRATLMARLASVMFPK